MSTLFDLRQHFGIWKRCGNTRFFQKNPDNPWGKIFLNPLDGILVSAHRRSPLDQEPRYDLVVRNAKKASNEEVQQTFSTDTPWIRRAVHTFFYLQSLGWASEFIKRFTGQPKTQGDPEVRNMLKIYHFRHYKYLKEGSSPDDDRPMLEEALAAILATIAALPKTIVNYGRNLSEEDLEYAFAELGIMEC